MPSPFSTHKVWLRNIERVKNGAPPTTALRKVLLLTLLKPRAKEMKKLLAAARDNAAEIPAALLEKVAAKYTEPPVTIELARLHRDAGRLADALALLENLPPADTWPNNILTLWGRLVIKTGHPAPNFQVALESSIAKPSKHHTALCTTWINASPFLPAPTTVTTQIADHIATTDLLTPAEQAILLHALTYRPGDKTPDLPPAELDTPTTILIITTTRKTLASLDPTITTLSADGHTVRTFSLDCLRRRDKYWHAEGHTRPLRKPSLQFLGDQRLTSIRLLSRLLTSTTQVLVPKDDPGTPFISSLPAPHRPQLSELFPIASQSSP